MQRKYELNVFLRPTLSNEEIAKVVGKVKNYIADGKGEILEEKAPEKRKLPFIVKKFKDCYYYYVKFEADSLVVIEVSEKVRLTEDVIRFMVSSAVKIEVKEVPEAAKAVEPVAQPAAAPAAEEGPAGGAGTVV